LVWEKQVLVHRHLLELVVLHFYKSLVFGRVKLADVSEEVFIDTLVPGTRLDSSYFRSTEGLNLDLILGLSLFLVLHDFSGYILFKSYSVMVQYKL